MNSNTNFSAILCITVFLASSCDLALAEEKEIGIATAPLNSEAFESSFEGTWFVDTALKKKHDSAVALVERLNKEINGGEREKVEGTIALKKAELALKEVRRSIEESKTRVSAFDIKTETIEKDIELGPERLMIVTADRIKIVGWHEPHARIVFVKKVLSVEAPVEDHLAALEVTHEHSVASELVGQTAAEDAAELETFANSEAAQKMTPENLARSLKWRQQKSAANRLFAPFQGKKANILNVKGLTGQEGNQQVRYEIKTPKGNGQVGSRWRRHADLTLFVPKCTALLLRGCEAGVDISGVQGQLVLTSDGSRNRDYGARWSINEHRGDVTIWNIPMDSIQHVFGDVLIESTAPMSNTGTRHRDGTRTAYAPEPRPFVVSDITGNLTARFTCSDLRLNDMLGKVNVRNDFGRTHLTISAALEDTNHRLVSQSGDVHVTVAAGVAVGTPIYLATCCGTAMTNLSRKQLDDSNTTGAANDGTRRRWRSFFTPKPGDQFRFSSFGRAESVLSDAKRLHGLDLISVAGRVEFVQHEE